MAPMDEVVLPPTMILHAVLCFWLCMPKESYGYSEILPEYVCDEVYMVEISSGEGQYRLRYHYGTS